MSQLPKNRKSWLKRHGFTDGTWRLKELERSRKMAKARREKQIIHLHWLWHRGPSAMQGVFSGIGACGARQLAPAQFTAHEADANCPACHGVVAARAKASPPEPPAAAPARVAKGQGPKPASGSSRGRGKLPPANGAATIAALVKQNPRKPGTAKHGRMAVLLQHNGKTIDEYVKAGGNLETLKNAIIEQIVELKS